MTVDSIYLNGQKYAADKTVGWTQYNYYGENTNGCAPCPANWLDPFTGKISATNVYRYENGWSTFAISDPFKIELNGKISNISLFAYHDVNRQVQYACLAEENYNYYKTVYKNNTQKRL